VNTDVLNPDGNLVHLYDAPNVRLSQNSEPPKTEDAIISTLYATTISQSAGGQELDFAEVVYTGTNPLINRSQPASFARMADVLLSTDERQRLLVGDYTTETESLQAQAETLSSQIQLRPYHFGDPLGGETWQNPLDSTKLVIRKTIEFNPVVDGNVYGNRSSIERTDGKAFLWCSVAATRSQEAATYSGQTAETWTLKTAVEALCWFCNTDETHIENPTDAAMNVLTGGPSVEAISMPPGLYLPTYLDRLLHPLGFNWYVTYDIEDDTSWKKQKPQLAFFQRGDGDEKQIFIQAPGKHLELEATNCDEYTIRREIGDNHNCVRVLGDWERREVTLPLYPAWSEDHDEKSAADLKKSESDGDYREFPHVWRLWVANEAGDINGLRSSSMAAGNPPDLSAHFTIYIPRRRRIEPPLRYVGEVGGTNRQDIGLEVQTTSEEWETFAGGWSVMPDQIGIMFTDDEPPTDVTAVRITGTIAGDARVEGVAERLPHAVNARSIWLELLKPEKFHDRAIVVAGDYASVGVGSSTNADTRDDTGAIAAYAESLRDQSGHAEVDCQLTMPGIHLHYKIGDLITNIEGREVSLNAASTASPADVFPQVTKRTFRFDPNSGPTTILTLDRGVPLETVR